MLALTFVLHHRSDPRLNFRGRESETKLKHFSVHGQTENSLEMSVKTRDHHLLWLQIEEDISKLP